MGIAKYPSVVTMPAAEQPYPSIVDFLVQTFPNVPRRRWAERILEGKVLSDTGRPITAETAYAPSRRLFYFRETEHEPVIPFASRVLFQNDEILVACKPHFLPVIPGGRYVEECVMNRLRAATGIDDLVPMHRLDRDTAGVILCSVNKRTRGRYQTLFMQGQVDKTYHAIAHVPRPPEADRWTVENRIVRGDPRFRMTVVPGAANARTHIELLGVHGNRALFRLQPITGKTHQLRLHMSGLGFPIINDRVYPDLQPERDDNFEQPLQLLAKAIRFRDPVCGTERVFQSERELLWEPSWRPAG